LEFLSFALNTINLNIYYKPCHLNTYIANFIALFISFTLVIFIPTLLSIIQTKQLTNCWLSLYNQIIICTINVNVSISACNCK